MSIYFLDTEFLEGTQKRFFGKTKPTIDLISIGMVAEDGREYYAISKDFNLKEAWNRYDIVTEQVYGDQRNIFPEGIKKKVYWIRENVLKPIFDDFLSPIQDSIDNNYRKFTINNFKFLLNKYGKSNKEIANEIIDFTFKDSAEILKNGIKFYTYYGNYDWVVFCWLFGRMIDLPKGFPMYSKDLKQTLDEKQENRYKLKEIIDKTKVLTKHEESELVYPLNLKDHPNYPKQSNEHNALEDAKWNKKLYEFLQKV